MGQAARAQHHRRPGSGRAAGGFPGACLVTHTTAGIPPYAAQLAGSDGNAVPAADRHAAADGNAAADEPAHHRTAGPGAHPVGDVGNALTAAGPPRHRAPPGAPGGPSAAGRQAPGPVPALVAGTE